METTTPPPADAATLSFTITVQPAATLYVGCSADAETWRGLRVCSERPRDGYDRDAFGTGYSTLEDDIIAALPPTMKANGQVYTPYSCIAFDITPSGTAATDIEHIVALAEGSRQRNRRRSATGHRQRPRQSHNCGSDGEPLAKRCGGRCRMDADPPRRMVRGSGDPGKARIRVDCRYG